VGALPRGRGLRLDLVSADAQSQAWVVGGTQHARKPKTGLPPAVLAHRPLISGLAGATIEMPTSGVVALRCALTITLACHDG
jgi:hypothetical protein